MLLVLLDGRLSWVSDVPYLRASVVKSHFPLLHVLIVCLTVQLNIILVVRRTQHTVAFTLFSTALIHLRSYGSSSLGPVFHAHSSCRQKVELLQ